MKKAQVKSKKNQEITKTNQTFSWFLGALIKKSRPPNVDLKVLKDRKIRFKFRFLISDQRGVKKERRNKSLVDNMSSSKSKELNYKRNTCNLQEDTFRVWSGFVDFAVHKDRADLSKKQ